jgi:hypothetical protein
MMVGGVIGLAWLPGGGGGGGGGAGGFLFPFLDTPISQEVGWLAAMACSAHLLFFFATVIIWVWVRAGAELGGGRVEGEM